MYLGLTNENLNRQEQDSCSCFFEKMKKLLRFYEINPDYIDYLSAFAPHLFRNKKVGQANERKYIGIVLTVNGMSYFVPLSSFKDKHRRMRNSIDFIRLKEYAVLNINTMFPAPIEDCAFVDINSVQDRNYRNLLRNEYRLIKVLENTIIKSARIVYSHKIANGERTRLASRCNDFRLLESKCAEWTKEARHGKQRFPCR